MRALTWREDMKFIYSVDIMFLEKICDICAEPYGKEGEFSSLIS
jgi:hypothetical protein